MERTEGRAKMAKFSKGPQDDQAEQLVAEIAGAMDDRFSEIDKKLQDKLAAHARDIARMSEAAEDRDATWRKRFAALGEDMGRAGFKGMFPSLHEAAQFGKLAIALLSKNPEEIAKLQNASVNPSVGEKGGYLLPDSTVGSIIRHVEEYGVAEANATRRDVLTQTASEPKRTSGPTISYPDLGVDATESDLKFGRTRFNLTRYTAFCAVDRWMLRMELAAQLGEFIAQELAWSLAYAQDRNLFVGDGTNTFAKVTGIFNRANSTQLTVTADAGDDTFAEVVAASVKYLTKAVGLLPEWADRDAAWYMHRSIFWGFLGARDSQNRPVADIIMSNGRPQKVLVGYPVNTTQVAPKLADTAVSKTMAVLANLKESHRIYRLSGGVEFRQSEHVRFLKGEICFLLDVLQDIVEADDQGYVLVKTAAS